MSLLFTRGLAGYDTGYSNPFNFPTNGSVGPRFRRSMNRRTAMAHSAFWASLRLRADLISTLPVKVQRTALGRKIDVPTPLVLVTPDGDRIDITEHLYSSQVDLDSVGNNFAFITEVDGLGLPARLDLIPIEEVVVQVRDGILNYRVAGKEYDASKIWHERQYTSSGLVVGLSPLAHAAMSLVQHMTAQEFAINWFNGGAIPTGVLKYEAAKLIPKETEAARARFKLSIENGEPWVTGKDWDYKIIEAQASQNSFIDTMRLTDVDIIRFLGVPGDLIDVQTQGSTVTYANITQRNLQLLVMNLGPAIVRREKALSRLTAKPRTVHLDTKALLRMDPQTVQQVLGQQIKDRMLAPSEARDENNLEPFTPEQIAEFASDLFKSYKVTETMALEPGDQP